jgi:hypothetical protein
MTDLVLSPAAVGTLHEGRQAYVAVAAARGPHVTPELYAWSGGQLWFAVATSTLKAKVLARRSRAGAVVTVGDRSVVLVGRAEVLDPTKPHRLAGQLRRFPDAAAAMTRFAARNAPDLLAFVGDTLSGRLGRRLPPPRLVIGLVPDAACVVERGQVVEGAGTWSDLARSGAPGDPAGPAAGDHVVAALPGPVAVPARWREDAAELEVAAAVLDRLDLDRAFPLAFVGDEYRAPGPAAKQGLLVRGTGRRGDRPGVVHVDAQAVVAWDGVDSDTEELGPDPADEAS